MDQPTWEIVDRIARLSHPRLSGEVSVERPDRGLYKISIGPHALDYAEVLGLLLPAPADAMPQSASEWLRRGNVLVAGYSESADWPVCVDVVWRAIPANESRGILGGVDLIASVRTALLESWPELAAGSRVAADQAWCFADSGAGRLEPRGVRAEDGVVGSIAPALFVFRLARVPFSYAEMVHPADIQGTALTRRPVEPCLLETRHRLFAERLEKGVILRSRVRGLFIHRGEDLRAAAQCYAEFAAADPPLGT